MCVKRFTYYYHDSKVVIVNFKKLIDSILFEEVDLSKYDELIQKFNDGKKTINIALRKGIVLNHNDDILLDSLKDIIKNIVTEYNKKKLAHQNTSSEIKKYNELLKSITEYNKIYNLYKSLRGGDGKTVGDCFRQLGGKTSKSSIYTKRNK